MNIQHYDFKIDNLKQPIQNRFYLLIKSMGKAEFEGLSERIKTVREKLNLSQRQFARKIYVSQTLVNEIELDKRKIQLRTLHLMAHQLNVNIEWLKTGIGSIFTSPPADSRLENIIEIFNKLDNPLQEYLLTQSKELLKMQKEIKN